MSVPPFHLNPGEAILYQTQPPDKWYRSAGRIVVSLLEVAVFILFSFTAFTALLGALLGTFLPAGIGDPASRIVFQGIVPLFLIAWFAEDTAQTFTSRLVLTSQRIWMKGSPYAWSQVLEIPLEFDQVHVFPTRGIIHPSEHHQKDAGSCLPGWGPGRSGFYRIYRKKRGKVVRRILGVFFLFRLLPECFHFVQAKLGKFPGLFFRPRLHKSEALFEALIGATQGKLGIDLLPA